MSSASMDWVRIGNFSNPDRNRRLSLFELPPLAQKISRNRTNAPPFESLNNKKWRPGASPAATLNQTATESMSLLLRRSTRSGQTRPSNTRSVPHRRNADQLRRRWRWLENSAFAIGRYCQLSSSHSKTSSRHCRHSASVSCMIVLPHRKVPSGSGRKYGY